MKVYYEVNINAKVTNPFTGKGLVNGSKLVLRTKSRAKAYKAGIMFHPDSPYYKVCEDIVVKYPRVEDVVNGTNTTY